MMGAAQKLGRQFEITEKILLLIEESGFSIGEAEKVPQSLEAALKENSRRLEKEKPFAVYRD